MKTAIHDTTLQYTSTLKRQAIWYMFYPTVLVQQRKKKMHKGTLNVTHQRVITKNVAQCHADFSKTLKIHKVTPFTQPAQLKRAFPFEQLYTTEAWLFHYLDALFVPLEMLTPLKGPPLQTYNCTWPNNLVFVSFSSQCKH